MLLVSLASVALQISERPATRPTLDALSSPPARGVIASHHGRVPLPRGDVERRVARPFKAAVRVRAAVLDHGRHRAVEAPRGGLVQRRAAPPLVLEVGVVLPQHLSRAHVRT